MRIVFAAVVASLAFAPVPAFAYENFIPLGHNYSPDNSELTEINSEEYKLNAQVDIYEAEIYRRQRTAKSFNSQLDRFANDQEFKGSSEFIDY